MDGKVDCKMNTKLSSTEKKILNELYNNKYLTINELMSLLTLSRTSITNAIASLKRKRIIKRVGSDKSGYYEIIVDDTLTI